MILGLSVCLEVSVFAWGSVWVSGAGLQEASVRPSKISKGANQIFECLARGNVLSYVFAIILMFHS